MNNLAQFVPMDWTEIEKIKKFPSSHIIKKAVKIGIKESYSSVEYDNLNQNGDVKRITKGDIVSFVILCHELYDRSIIKNQIK